jgi:phenylacetate-coenzyme A ligase PaaK-like adenylate-forming protein
MKTRKLTTQWQRLPEAEVRRLQFARLRDWLQHVVLPFSAHYRELFRVHGLRADHLRSLDDWQKVPFTSKADLLGTAGNPHKIRDFILVPDRNVLARRTGTIVRALWHGRDRVRADFEREFRPLLLTTTTGRSADAIPFVFSQHDLDNLALAGRRLFEVCGAQPDMRLLNMFPFAPHLAFWQTHYGGTAFGVFVASTGGGKVMGTEGQLRFIRKLKPDVLIGMPTFVYHVLHHAAAEGVRCENLRRLVLGGEKVPDGMRRKLVSLAKELGAPTVDVVATYGFTEAKMAWAECPVAPDDTPAGYHLYPDLGLVEIVDPDSGLPVLDGQPGEIVFTPLDARGTVVLRYRTGDLIDGGLTHTPCPHCGRRVPRLVGTISRRSEVRAMQLDKLKGTLVDFNELEHVLDNVEHIGAWQVELRKQDDDPLEVDELVLHVHKVNGCDEERLRTELRRRFLEHLEITPNRILFHSADEMRSLQGVGTQLKEQRLVDRRPGKAGATLPSAPSEGGAAEAAALDPREVRPALERVAS